MKDLQIILYPVSSLIIIFANIINILSHIVIQIKYGNRKDKPIENCIDRTR